MSVKSSSSTFTNKQFYLQTKVKLNALPASFPFLSSASVKSAKMTREQDAIVKEKTIIGIIEDRADCRELKQKKHINEFTAICFKELNIFDKALYVSSHEGKDAKRGNEYV